MLLTTFHYQPVTSEFIEFLPFKEIRNLSNDGRFGWRIELCYISLRKKQEL